MKHSASLFFVSLLILLINGITATAQDTRSRFGFSYSNNVTSFPVTGYPQVFYSQLHPGINLCRSWKINKAEKSNWIIGANGGFYYHRFIQLALHLYPSITFERVLGTRWRMGLGIGGGYVYAIENSQVFVQVSTDNGNSTDYDRKTIILGRSQYMAEADLSASFALRKNNPDAARLFIQLKSSVQGPYVANYVPLLPINSFLIGFSFPIN
jgi:hypothetical protein